MMRKLFAPLISTLVFFTACNTEEKKAEPIAVVLKNPVTAMDADERFATADSAIVVFYDDPFGSDSLRYTRYYKQVSVTDSLFLTQIKHGLQLPFTKLEKVRPCRSQGKLWLYSKQKVFQTLYFAHEKPGCAHMYFIKDGFMYYVDIQQPTIDAIEHYRSKAKVPALPADN